MGLREVAEAIILQALEDLSQEAFMRESVSFFEGNDFTVCAQIAGLDTESRIYLLRLAQSIISSGQGGRTPKKTGHLIKTKDAAAAT